ncbi:MAG: hypothetical protein QM664_04345 [Flavihumibacter sp.]
MLKQPHEIMELFRAMHLHATGNRMTVYTILQAAGRAMTVAEVVQASKQALDRVSVHRALKLFSRKGMVASLLGHRGSERYLLLNAAGQSPAPGLQVMATCAHCNKTEIWKVDAHSLPVADSTIRMNPRQVLITGICEDCSNRLSQ